MQKTILTIGFLILLLGAFCQTAPAHLNYFGYVAIDCLYDDPLDASSITNYISEVDTFSNLAHMCSYSETDDIVDRVNLMNSKCVQPLLHIENLFYSYIDTNAPSGYNLDLLPDFSSRWNTFKTINSSVLNSSNIGAFYIVDEPYWNGLTLSDLDTVFNMVKNDFPDIPILLVEGYTAISNLEIPIASDWIGFDMYGVFDPSTDPIYLANLDTIKAARNANQKIFLIIDDQWFPEYQTYLGWSQDTMATVVENYYTLAVADTSIVGLIGYIWPGGLDSPSHRGVRNLTPAVINKNVEIGSMIKANYSPCTTIGLSELSINSSEFTIYPNPSNDKLFVSFNTNDETADFKLYNAIGQLVLTESINNQQILEINSSILKTGIYLATLTTSSNIIFSEKISVNK